MNPSPDPVGEALIVVDVQNDFVSGSLAVPNHGAFRVIPIINNLTADFARRRKPVFYTACYHLPNHPSFIEHGGPWPPHCVIGTWGSYPPDDLLIEGSRIIVKGIDRECYSGFEILREGGRAPLDTLLRYFGAQRLTICGIATDYCVKHTVLDAAALDYDVVVALNACAGIAPDTTDMAIADMRANARVRLA